MTEHTSEKGCEFFEECLENIGRIVVKGMPRGTPYLFDIEGVRQILFALSEHISEGSFEAGFETGFDEGYQEGYSDGTSELKN
jgi:hypothetical protein